MGLQHPDCDPRGFLYKLIQWIFCNFRPAGCKLHQGGKAGIRSAKNSVPESRHDFAVVDSRPNVFFDVVIAVGRPNLILQSLDPTKRVLGC